MKKFSRRIIYLAVFAFLLVAMLAGCDKEEDVFEQIPEFKQENAIEINEDFSVISTLVDTFSEDYYQKDELLKMFSEEATAFNNENGAGSLIAEKVDVQDGLVNVVMKFSGREAYVAYHDAVFFVGTVEDALSNGLRLDKNLINISDTSKSVDSEGLREMKDAFILITNEHQEKGPLTATMFGKILYVSEGIERWYGGNSVRIAGVSDELIYVVFK